MVGKEQRMPSKHEVSGLSEKSKECQASTLLYCLGIDVEDILMTSHVSDDNKKYNRVSEKYSSE